jgi:hypothetical protein
MTVAGVNFSPYVKLATALELPFSALYANLGLNRRLKRGVFRSVAELQVAIDLFIAETNSDPKPFVWIATPSRILAAVKRGKQTLESLHYRRSVTRPKS